MLVYFFTVRLPYIAGNRVDKKTRFRDFADIFAKIYVPFGEHCMKIRNFFGTKFKKFRKSFLCGVTLVGKLGGLAVCTQWQAE